MRRQRAAETAKTTSKLPTTVFRTLQANFIACFRTPEQRALHQKLQDYKTPPRWKILDNSGSGEQGDTEKLQSIAQIYYWFFRAQPPRRFCQQRRKSRNSGLENQGTNRPRIGRHA